MFGLNYDDVDMHMCPALVQKCSVLFGIYYFFMTHSRSLIKYSMFFANRCGIEFSKSNLPHCLYSYGMIKFHEIKTKYLSHERKKVAKTNRSKMHAYKYYVRYLSLFWLWVPRLHSNLLVWSIFSKSCTACLSNASHLKTTTIFYPLAQRTKMCDRRFFTLQLASLL